MNKQITIIIGITLISLVSAMYPGQCETIKFPNQAEVNFTIIENTSSMEGFTWKKDGYDITYCFSTDFVPGNYSFEWSNYQDSITKPTIIYPSSGGGGGGGGGSKIIYRDVPKYEIAEGEGETITETDTITKTETVEIKKTPVWVWVLVGVLILIAVGLIYKNAKGSEEDENCK